MYVSRLARAVRRLFRRRPRAVATPLMKQMRRMEARQRRKA